jgi:hypothetical protein
MINIVLFGKPGAGKEPSRILKGKYNLTIYIDR